MTRLKNHCGVEACETILSTAAERSSSASPPGEFVRNENNYYVATRPVI